MRVSVVIYTHICMCVRVCTQQLGSVSLPLESKNKWQKCQQFCALHCHNDDKERALECFSLCHWVSASVCHCVCVWMSECCALINTNKYLQFPTPTKMWRTIKLIAQRSMEFQPVFLWFHFFFLLFLFLSLGLQLSHLCQGSTKMLSTFALSPQTSSRNPFRQLI